jgi:type II secretory pathway predicted ATPase ExeA
MDSASLITLVLLGQPGTLWVLTHKLRFAPYEALYEALYQRIAVRFHLKPFDLEETAGYIKHHLHIAGRQDQLFSQSFISGVYDHTKGVARKINNLCHNALLLGATENKRVLDDGHLKRVILDLEGQVG